MRYLTLILIICSTASYKVASNVLLFSQARSNSPEQVHISYGEIPSEITVTWNTARMVPTPLVQYGEGRNRSKSSIATSRVFVDGGELRRSQVIHRASLSGLKPGVRYSYRVGSANGDWSQVFSFKSMRTDANFAPRFAVYGDLGLINPQSIPRLKSDIKKDMYDAVLHVGDFGYDLSSDNAEVGDAFMRMMEPVAANIPYMTCPGNHEHNYNFSNYKARFTMPGDNGKMFYSFNIGPVHIISISTEYYYYFYYGISQILTQYRWLVNDLKEANKTENRQKRPWIIMMGHRPMYCSNDDGDCNILTRILRDGIPFIDYPGLESLLKDYGVDLAIWAHEHSYERMWPTYNNVVVNSSTPGNPYLNPRATVHVVTGSAGCQEHLDTFGYRKPFTAFRSQDYGYSRLYIQNSTHLMFEQVSDNKNGTVIDKFVLVREKHTPF